MVGADETTVIGFGCLWNSSRAETWSHAPAALYDALDQTGPCVDLGFDMGFRRHIARVRYTRMREGTLRSSWRYQESTLSAATRAISKAAAESNPDAILTVQDIGIFDRPFLIYQDMSYDVVLREIRAGNDEARANFSALSIAQLEHLRGRQHEVFARASGILAMSEWYRRSLIEETGLSPELVHVVRPGATAVGKPHTLAADAGNGKLLFVGRDFTRKGGDLLVEAVRTLRTGGHDLSITIIGPARRPPTLPDEPWIDFCGELPPLSVAESIRSHTAFVLPTRFEGYGIVFHEALRVGVPCVGPDAFAIPEIITDGVDGALFSDWTSDSVVEAIERSLEPALRASAIAGAATRAEELSWTRAALEVRDVANRVVRDGSPSE